MRGSTFYQSSGVSSNHRGYDFVWRSMVRSSWLRYQTEQTCWIYSTIDGDKFLDFVLLVKNQFINWWLQFMEFILWFDGNLWIFVIGGWIWWKWNLFEKHVGDLMVIFFTRFYDEKLSNTWSEYHFLLVKLYYFQ